MSERMTWRNLALLAVFGSALAAACTVGGDDSDGTDDNDGGSSHTTGGATTGGKGGTTATAGSGGSGTAGTGGSGTAGTGTGTAGDTGAAGEAGASATYTPTCDDTADSDPDEDGYVGTTYPDPGCATAGANECDSCLKAQCCAAYNICNSYEPYNTCGWGGPTEWQNGAGGEVACYVKCIDDKYCETEPCDASTVDVIDQDLVDECLGACQTTTPDCGGLAGQATYDLAACAQTNCTAECFD